VLLAGAVGPGTPVEFQDTRPMAAEGGR